MMAFLRQLGVQVQNPHSYVVQEGGFVGGAEAAIALKRTTDPHGLLNPGKLERRFYAAQLARGEDHGSGTE